jgi:tetratricopeptide (TPR) repeat protein
MDLAKSRRVATWLLAVVAIATVGCRVPALLLPDEEEMAQESGPGVGFAVDRFRDTADYATGEACWQQGDTRACIQTGSAPKQVGRQANAECHYERAPKLETEDPGYGVYQMSRGSGLRPFRAGPSAAFLRQPDVFRPESSLAGLWGADEVRLSTSGGLEGSSGLAPSGSWAQPEPPAAPIVACADHAGTAREAEPAFFTEPTERRTAVVPATHVASYFSTGGTGAAVAGSSGTRTGEHRGAAPVEQLLEQGRKALEAGSADAAHAYFRDAVLRNPENPRVALAAAVAALRHNQPQLAIDLVKHAIVTCPPSAALYRVLATAYYRLGAFQSSRSAVEQSLALDATSGLSHFLMGCTLMKLGQSEEAGEHFRQAARIDPRYAVRAGVAGLVSPEQLGAETGCVVGADG